MLTRRGVALVAGGAGCWAAGRLLGVTELYLLAVALPTLVAASALVVALTDHRLAVRRRLSAVRAHPGERLEVAIDLRNDGRLGTGFLLVAERCPYGLRGDTDGAEPRFVVPRVPAGAVRTLVYPLVTSSRGRWEIGPLDIRIRDPFGAAERTRRYSATNELIVYPVVEELPAGGRMGTTVGSGGRARRRMVGGGEEFHTIREYRTGDDYRRVHWSSTARHQQLMVRQNEQGFVARATVLLDTRTRAHRGVGDDGSFEWAVRAAASILDHFHGRGYETRLSVLGTRDADRPDDTLDGHLTRLALAETTNDADLRHAAGGFRNSDGLLVAVLGSAGPDPAGDPELLALLVAGRRFSSKAALVAAHGPADETVALLTAARWRAAVLANGVAEAWQRIDAQTPRRVGA